MSMNSFESGYKFANSLSRIIEKITNYEFLLITFYLEQTRKIIKHKTLY